MELVIVQDDRPRDRGRPPDVDDRAPRDQAQGLRLLLAKTMNQAAVDDH